MSNKQLSDLLCTYDGFASWFVDFSFDFCRIWPHTDMLNEFCIKLDLCTSARHSRNETDYMYNFAKRFNSLDHFIMSCVLFDSAVDDIWV